MGHVHAGPAGLRDQNRRRLWAAATIAFLVFLAEAAGGILSNSLALLADSGHLLADLGSLGMSLLAMRLAQRPPDARKTYGYRHGETIAAFINGLLVMALSGWIIWEAFLRLRSPEHVRGGLMLAVTLASLIGNIGAMALLYGGQKTSLNVRGAFLHIVGDVLGSVAALVAAAGIFLLNTTILDPIASLVVALLILFSATALLRHSGSRLMLAVPEHIAFEEVQNALREIPQVRHIHDLHVWSVGEHAVALSCHLVAEEVASRAALLAAAQQVLRRRFAITHSAIQIESAQGACPAELSCAVP
jgi:cobalt-zinc-cadmium efflux system protein